MLEELFSRSLDILDNLRKQTEEVYYVATSITDEITNDVGENLRIPGTRRLVEAAHTISSPLWQAKEELDELRSSIKRDYSTYAEQEGISGEDTEEALRGYISKIENIEHSVAPVLRSAKEALDDIDGQLGSFTRHLYDRRDTTWAERLRHIHNRVSETRETVERLETRTLRDFEEPKERAVERLSHIEEERTQEESRDDSSVEPPQEPQVKTAPKPRDTAPDESAETESEPAAVTQEPASPKRVEPLTSSQELRAAAAQRQTNPATVAEPAAQTTSEALPVTPDDPDQAIEELQRAQVPPPPKVRAPLTPPPTSQPRPTTSAEAPSSEQTPPDETIELTETDLLPEEGASPEEPDDLAAAIEEFQAKRVVAPPPLPRRPATPSQATPTNDVEELTDADLLPDEAPAEARTQTTEAETESDDLAAAIEELQTKQATSEAPASAQVPTRTGIPPLASVAAPSIQAERVRLREEKAQTESNQRLLSAYNERLQAGSLKILHERYPKQERAWQALSKTLGTSVDAFALVPPEARSQVHLQAVVETRAAFPDLTEVALSALIESAAREQMAALQQNALAQAAMAGAEAALAAQSVAHLGMGRALVQVAQQTLSHADALSQNEVRLAERGATLRQGSSTAAPEAQQAEEDRLRAQQQQDTNARHGLQIALRASLGNLETLAAGAEAAQQAAAAQQTSDQVALLLGDTLAVAAPQHASVTPSTGGSLGNSPTPEAFHAQQASALRSAQARSAMQRLPTTRGSRSAARSNLDAAGDTASEPLLQLPQKPDSPQASFSRAQRAMTERQRQFLGTTRRGSGGGYEAMFGLAGAGVMASEADADEEAPVLEEGETVYLDDPDLREQVQAEELARQQQEARQQEAQEQAETEEEAAQEQTESEGASSPQDLANKADAIQKIAKNPAVQKLLTGGGMALTAVLAIFVIILIILWLNLRMIAPKEGSLLRKPLSGMGIFGVILLDIVTILGTLLSLLITIGILFLPIAPFAFALGAVPPSLQSAIIRGFGWASAAIFR
ncbi:MAG: hypothetical protein QG668_565 [Patescibacteria group bacterium]|nr:hypothetical protein [Patescibacteria group bacterium]